MLFMAFQVQLYLFASLVLTATGCPQQPTIRPWHLPAITSDDPIAEAELREARELVERGAVEEAEKRFMAFLREHPKDPLIPIAQLGLGRILITKNRLKEASVLFDRVAQHADASVAEQGRFYQAITAQRQGNNAKAIELLEPMQGRTIDSEDTVLLYRSLAAAYTGQGDSVGALKALDSLCKEAVTERDRAQTRAELSEIAAKKANREQVLRAYEELDHAGQAWPLIAKRALVDADREGAVDKMREILRAIKEQGLELDAGLEALALRATRPVDANPQVIGAILSLTGRAREVGDLALRGLMLAADLPPNGPPALASPQILIRDDAGDPERAVQAVDELVSVHRVVAIIGPIEARAAKAAAARAAELSVPLITLAPLAQLTEVGSTIFRLFPTPEDEARALVVHAVAQGLSRFAILYPKGPYGTVMRESFEREVTSRKAEVVAAESYEPQATDFRDSVEALRKVEFDALFIPDSPRRIALIAPALAVAGLWCGVPGTRVPNADRTISLLLPAVAFDYQLVKDASRYLQGAIFSAPFDPNTATGPGRIFADQFAERFGSPANAFAAFAHDAYRLVRAAVAAGAGTRSQVGQRLSELRDAGVAGPSQGFTPSRTPLQPTRLLQLQGEEFIVAETVN
jgi:branched-chain amino acid transport system substrate-binding protein